MGLTKSQAQAKALSHQFIKKNKNGTWGIKNRKVGGNAVTKRKFNSTKLHKSKSKSIYSFHHGKKNCGKNGFIGPLGWCQGRRRLVGRGGKKTSFWLRVRSRSRSPRKKRKLA